MFRWHGQTDGDLVIVPSSPTQIGTYGKEHGVSTQLCNVVKAVRFGCTRKVGLPGGKTLGQSPGFRDGSGLSPPPRSSLTKDLPQNQEVFSQGRFSKGNQVPPEARRTTSKCPLKRRTLQSPELAEISLLLVSRRIFLFCFVFSFSFFFFSFFSFFPFVPFQRITRVGYASNIFNSSFGGEKEKWARPHSESFFKACGNRK